MTNPPAAPPEAQGAQSLAQVHARTGAAGALLPRLRQARHLRRDRRADGRRARRRSASPGRCCGAFRSCRWSPRRSSLVFGSLTLILHDETLIKIKPTALYLAVRRRAVLRPRAQKPLLKIMFDGALHVTEEGWRKLTWRWAFFFLALAVLNEIVWRTPDDRPLGQVQDLRLPAADAAVRARADAADHAHESKEDGFADEM